MDLLMPVMDGITAIGHIRRELPDVEVIAVKEAIYRVAQEALHNVVKPARARRVSLSLGQEDGTIVLVVEDDGQGFDPAGEFPGHLGLRSMRERVERLGGQFSLTSAPGEGSRLCVRLAAPDAIETAARLPTP